MVQEIKVKELVFAEDSFYKTQRVIVGSKSFQTPIKAIDLKKNISGISTNSAIKGVNELYRIFNSKSINTILSSDREQLINNEIQRYISKYSSKDDLNICFAEFEEPKIPNKDELEYLTNLSYVHSNITPLPLLPKLMRELTPEKFQKYLEFVNNAVDTIEEHNHKPIMGVIPIRIPSIFIPTLLDTFVKKGITAFCLDFQGSTVDSSITKIRALVKSLKKEKIFEKSFIYSLNLGAGKLPKSKDVVPAKDILSFGYGFDAIGGNHVRKFLSLEVRAKILSQKNIFENSLRLFNKKDYGYYRTTKKETVERIYPKGSCIPLDYLEAVKRHKDVDKVFNQEQQGLEAVNLRTVVKEQHEVLKYLNKKEFVDKNDIKSLGNIKTKK